jgi:hypothetical protein
MLYLLASGQARTRQAMARLLGVHRNTVSHWLAVYAAGGLAASLATYVPRRKPVSLAPAVLASLAQALRPLMASPPMKRCTYECGGRTARQSNIKRCTRSCARAFEPSSKCRTPVTPKKPDAIPIFQATCQAHLQRAILATNARPVRVLSQDESHSEVILEANGAISRHAGESLPVWVNPHQAGSGHVLGRPAPGGP